MRKIIALSALLALGALGMACGDSAPANNASNANANRTNTVANAMNAAANAANTAANTIANAANAVANAANSAVVKTPAKKLMKVFTAYWLDAAALPHA